MRGLLSVQLWFIFRAPTRLRKAERERQETFGMFRRGKPDLDNLIKLVMDAANGILWKDDANVVKLEALRVYGESAKTTIKVSEIRE